MKSRNRTQSMGYWLNEPAILEPERIQDAMNDLADAGYGIVRMMLRNTNFTHRSPRVVEAVKLAVETARARGVRVVLDCEPHSEPVAHDMGGEFPEAMGSRLVGGRGKIVNGMFHLHMKCPSAEAKQPIFGGVEAAFLQRGDTVERIEPFAFDLTSELSMYNDPACEEKFVFHRPAHPTRSWRLFGHLSAPTGTELIVYVRIRDFRLVDFWAEGFRRYYESLLDCYRDIPLDGIGWDEPAFGGDWTSYRYGEAFAQEFKRRNGYRLADRLWLLDEPGTVPESVRVRLDYYHTLNEGVFEAQKHLFQNARALFGNDILLGTHHTWQGEGGINDYRAGAVDYFRLNDNMDAGYTDCNWWDMKSVSYAYALASSLGRLTPSGEAECNTWHWKPTNGQIQYHSRLMTLMDIIWFNIWYGDDADVCQYPTHYTWAQNIASLRQHRDNQARLKGARPVIDVAIWHGWEGVTAMNQTSIASAQKSFCLNTSHLFLDRNVAFDFIDSRLIESAKIEGNKLVSALGRHGILVLPYAAVLPRAAWDRCVAFARAGGKLLIVGPPPEIDTDGRPLGEEFAALLKMPSLRLADYMLGIAADPAWTNRLDKFDVTYPLSGDPDRILTSVEGEPHGIRSPEGNVIYFSDLDPGLRLLNQVQKWLTSEVECFSESIQWRLYRREGKSILVCIARKHEQMSGIIRFAKHQIEIKHGIVAFIEESDGKVALHGDELEATCAPMSTISSKTGVF